MFIFGVRITHDQRRSVAKRVMDVAIGSERRLSATRSAFLRWCWADEWLAESSML